MVMPFTGWVYWVLLHYKTYYGLTGLNSDFGMAFRCLSSLVLFSSKSTITSFSIGWWPSPWSWWSLGALSSSSSCLKSLPGWCLSSWRPTRECSGQQSHCTTIQLGTSLFLLGKPLCTAQFLIWTGYLFTPFSWEYFAILCTTLLVTNMQFLAQVGHPHRHNAVIWDSLLEMLWW